MEGCTSNFQWSLMGMMVMEISVKYCQLSASYDLKLAWNSSHFQRYWKQHQFKTYFLRLLHIYEARVQAKTDAKWETSKCECMWGTWNKGKASYLIYWARCPLVSLISYYDSRNQYAKRFFKIADKEELLAKTLRQFHVLFDRSLHTFAFSIYGYGQS